MTNGARATSIDQRLAKSTDTSVTPVLAGGVLPWIDRLTLTGVEAAFSRWWTPQHTLNHLHVLYETGCLSYPRTDQEGFATRQRAEALEWVKQIATVFTARGWGLLRVDDWRPDPALFDDHRLGAHTGLHPVFSDQHPVLPTLDSLTDEQVLLYRAVAKSFVRRAMDPAVLRQRLETFELHRAVVGVQRELRTPGTPAALTVPRSRSSSLPDGSPPCWPGRSRKRL